MKKFYPFFNKQKWLIKLSAVSVNLWNALKCFPKIWCDCRNEWTCLYLRANANDILNFKLFKLTFVLQLHHPSTMSKYTEESLNKMLKKDLIPNVLNLQSKIAENNINSNELLEETRMFNDIFSKLHSELALIRKVNTELAKRIVTLEQHLNVKWPVL